MTPSYLGLEITDRCDLACSHCLRLVVPPHAARARDLDVDLVRRVCAEAKEIGISSVALTGGEPMLHPRFLDLVDAIVDHGMRYNFLSNGLGIAELMPRLLERPERRELLRDVSISLDGATEETHDAVRGRGTFRRSLAGIAVLRALDVPFCIVTTIQRLNRHEIDALGLLAHHLGATQISFAHFLPNGRPHATRDLDLTIPERLEVEYVIKRLMHAMRFKISISEGYKTDHVDYECVTIQRRGVNVDPNGHMTFCCELSNFYGDERPAETRSDWIADLAKTSLRDAIALQTAAIERFRRERLADADAGKFTEDDYFACRYCVRHFGKPEREIVQIRRRNTALI